MAGKVELDVRPGPPMNNHPNSMVRYAEPSRYLMLIQSLTHCPDILHYFLRELCTDVAAALNRWLRAMGTPVQPRCNGMAHVPKPISLLQITQSIVIFAAIDMISFFARRKRPKEGSKYHPMNRDEPLSAILAERNTKIRVPHLRLKNSLGISSTAVNS